MKKETYKQTKDNVLAAIGWASLVVTIEVITEFTGIRKYKLQPEPKTFLEVICEWPKFLISGVVIFLFGFYRLNSKNGQKKKGQS